MTRICSIEGCSGKHLAKGFCVKHYRRWQAHGDPNYDENAHFATPQEALAARTVRAENGCLEWIGSRSPLGYGRMKVNGVGLQSHRVAFELENGPIPDGMDVLHRCDNPPCCDPEHLFLGTHQDNMDDMYAKGRGKKAIGSQSGRTKLTEDDVRAIRADHRGARVLSRVYGVGKSTIGYIKSGKNWKHVK